MGNCMIISQWRTQGKCFYENSRRNQRCKRLLNHSLYICALSWTRFFQTLLVETSLATVCPPPKSDLAAKHRSIPLQPQAAASQTIWHKTDNGPQQCPFLWGVEWWSCSQSKCCSSPTQRKDDSCVGTIQDLRYFGNDFVSLRLCILEGCRLALAASTRGFRRKMNNRVPLRPMSIAWKSSLNCCSFFVAQPLTLVSQKNAAIKTSR